LPEQKLLINRFVSKFFDLLKAEYQKHNYPAHRIYNVDETSLSTVPGRNSKTFAKKGRKQVGRVTSAERGQSSTAVICMSAGGMFFPPMIIFSRKRMKPELKRWSSSRYHLCMQ
jgi:hypothetical protein